MWQGGRGHAVSLLGGGMACVWLALGESSSMCRGNRRGHGRLP